MGDEQGHVKGIKTVQIKWVQVRFILNQTLKLIRRCLETGARGVIFGRYFWHRLLFLRRE